MSVSPAQRRVLERITAGGFGWAAARTVTTLRCLRRDGLVDDDHGAWSSPTPAAPNSDPYRHHRSTSTPWSPRWPCRPHPVHTTTTTSRTSRTGSGQRYEQGGR